MTQEHPPRSSETPRWWDPVDPFDSSDPHYWIRLEHLGRYLFALDYLQENGAHRVIDAGAGTGYGAHLLAVGGLDVTALDCDIQNIAKHLGRSPDPEIRSVDVDLDNPTAQFPNLIADAIVLFEVLEHLRSPRDALARLTGLLKPGGTLLCSAPNRIWESQTKAGLPANLSHRTFFGRGELLALIESSELSVRYTLGQGLSNYLMRRETALLESGRFHAALATERTLNSPTRLTDLARLIGYPTADYDEWSYSFIIVAEKTVKTSPPR